MNPRKCLGRYSPFGISCVECWQMVVCKKATAIRLREISTAVDLNEFIRLFEERFDRCPTIMEFCSALGGSEP